MTIPWARSHWRRRLDSYGSIACSSPLTNATSLSRRRTTPVSASTPAPCTKCDAPASRPPPGRWHSARRAPPPAAGGDLGRHQSWRPTACPASAPSPARPVGPPPPNKRAELLDLRRKRLMVEWSGVSSCSPSPTKRRKESRSPRLFRWGSESVYHRSPQRRITGPRAVPRARRPPLDRAGRPRRRFAPRGSPTPTHRRLAHIASFDHSPHRQDGNAIFRPGPGITQRLRRRESRPRSIWNRA